MSTTYEFLQAPIVHRTCMGLLLCSLALTAQATQPKSPQLDLFAAQLAYTDINQYSAQFNSVEASASHNKRVLSEAPEVPAFSELKKGILCITGVCLHLTMDENNASLLPQLRFESKESRIEIQSSQRSVLMTWRRALP